MRNIIWRLQRFTFKLTWRYLNLHKILQIILLPIIILLGSLLSIICWLIFFMYYVPKYGLKEGWRIQIKDQMDHANKIIEELK